MKSQILLLALIVAFLSSCTTSYKTGQTPDDVYFSPVRPQEEYVQFDKKENNRQYRDNNDEYYEDQYLRMKVRSRDRWSEIDDPYYYSSRYNYSTFNCYCLGNPWTPTSYWNNYYNPYYQSHVILSPKATATYTAPRTFNLNSYNNNALLNSNMTINPKGSNNSSYNSYNNNNIYVAPRNNNSNNNSNSGNILRDIFKSSNNSSNNSSNSTNTNSSSSSSSGSSSGSSTPAPVRKF